MVSFFFNFAPFGLNPIFFFPPPHDKIRKEIYHAFKETYNIDVTISNTDPFFIKTKYRFHQRARSFIL